MAAYMAKSIQYYIHVNSWSYFLRCNWSSTAVRCLPACLNCNLLSSLAHDAQHPFRLLHQHSCLWIGMYPRCQTWRKLSLISTSKLSLHRWWLGVHNCDCLWRKKTKIKNENGHSSLKIHHLRSQAGPCHFMLPMSSFTCCHQSTSSFKKPSHLQYYPLSSWNIHPRAKGHTPVTKTLTQRRSPAGVRKEMVDIVQGQANESKEGPSNVIQVAPLDQA